jgi:hypothetical protein
MGYKKDCWRNIPISLIDPVMTQQLKAWTEPKSCPTSAQCPQQAQPNVTECTSRKMQVAANTDG